MNRRGVLSSLVGIAAGAPAAMAGTSLPSPLGILRGVDPPAAVGPLAMKLGDGGQVPLNRYRQRFIVLNVWASWCFPCREEMPSLSRLAARTAGAPVTVLPLAVERHGAEAVASFYRETAISNLPVLLGDGANIAEVFQEWGLPFTVLVDRNGLEVGRVTGAARWDDPAFTSWLMTRASA